MDELEYNITNTSLVYDNWNFDVSVTSLPYDNVSIEFRDVSVDDDDKDGNIEVNFNYEVYEDGVLIDKNLHKEMVYAIAENVLTNALEKLASDVIKREVNGSK